MDETIRPDVRAKLGRSVALRATRRSHVLVSHWPIRRKLQLGLGLLAISLCTLFGSAYYGLYNYRGLVKSLSARSTELPLANKLSLLVADMRETLGRVEERIEYAPDSLIPNESTGSKIWDADRLLPAMYDGYFKEFQKTLVEYQRQLDSSLMYASGSIRDDTSERSTLDKIVAVVKRIEHDDLDSMLNSELKVMKLRGELDTLRELTADLPTHMYLRIHALAAEVRTQYRWAITLAWVTAAVCILLLLAAILFFRKWITQPFHTLVAGSREVAAGKFDHRIRLESDDEMRELGEAMNAMTQRFQEIRDDLDRQVRERTKQVVRSEQLASVGFLAAGVAHEINNPLASIALCSESLEGRLSGLLEGCDESKIAECDVVRSYLEMIQKEAFRCKQITGKLLDFSRRGDPERHNTDLRELVSSVIEMVEHLGRNQNQTVKLLEGDPVIAEVCPQEMKQVILNLITNGLDSLDPGGIVTVSLSSEQGEAKIIVEDNGCGMTEEVIRHMFEPFFTRRRNGQGTGLGLSITHRIVEEHHGQIHVESDGVGRGARFIVSLPVRQPVARQTSQSQAA